MQNGYKLESPSRALDRWQSQEARAQGAMGTEPAEVQEQPPRGPLTSEPGLPSEGCWRGVWGELWGRAGCSPLKVAFGGCSHSRVALLHT